MAGEVRSPPDPSAVARPAVSQPILSVTGMIASGTRPGGSAENHGADSAGVV